MLKVTLTLDPGPPCLVVQDVTERILGTAPAPWFSLSFKPLIPPVALCLSPVAKTVVLGVTSRSRDGLKGNAHSCDMLSRSSRSSRSNLGSPIVDHGDSTTICLPDGPSALN